MTVIDILLESTPSGFEIRQERDTTELFAATSCCGGEATFDAYQKDWGCPRCHKRCDDQPVDERRGEQFLPSRFDIMFMRNKEMDLYEWLERWTRHPQDNLRVTVTWE